MYPGEKNVIGECLVKQEIILPPLHIKLRKIKQFVKLLVTTIIVLSTSAVNF